MSISVTEPIERAWNRMVEMLFKPFDMSKWFGLGFCVFLAYLGRGHFEKVVMQITGRVPWILSQLYGSPIPWARSHPSTVVWLVCGVLLFFLLLFVVISWIRSRGTFMLIDALAQDHGDVADPWRRHRELGNSLFGFGLIIFLIAFALTVASLVAAVFIAWPDIANETFGTPALWAIIVLVVVIPLTWVNYGILEMLLIDFIAPTMYTHGLRVRPAWKLWYREVFTGNFWRLTLFYLMKLVLGMLVGAIAGFVTCATFCLVFLPYIGAVILLPAFVFMRCYTLYFLEQFGEPWRLFVYDTGMMPCVSCGYDLRGNPGALSCPECGGPTPASMEDV